MITNSYCSFQRLLSRFAERLLSHPFITGPKWAVKVIKVSSFSVNFCIGSSSAYWLFLNIHIIFTTVVSSVSSIIIFSQVNFFLWWFLEYNISCWILFSSHVSKLCRPFCFISIFSAGYTSNILTTEIFLSRKTMLFGSS